MTARRRFWVEVTPRFAAPTRPMPVSGSSSGPVPRLTELAVAVGLEGAELDAELASVREQRSTLAAYEAGLIERKATLGAAHRLPLLPGARTDIRTAPADGPADRSDIDPDPALQSADDFLSDEVAVLLNMSVPSTRHLVENALVLVRQLPGVWQALADHRIDETRARVVVGVLGWQGTSAGGPVAEDTVADLAALGVGWAERGCPPSTLNQRLVAALIAVDPAAADRRAELRKRTADVAVTGTGDGLSELRATQMATADAKQVRAQIDAYARKIKADGDTRPIGAIRVAVLTALVTRPWEKQDPAVAHVTINADLADLIDHGHFSHLTTGPDTTGAGNPDSGAPGADTARANTTKPGAAGAGTTESGAPGADTTEPGASAAGATESGGTGAGTPEPGTTKACLTGADAAESGGTGAGTPEPGTTGASLTGADATESGGAGARTPEPATHGGGGTAAADGVGTGGDTGPARRLSPTPPQPGGERALTAQPAAGPQPGEEASARPPGAGVGDVDGLPMTPAAVRALLQRIDALGLTDPTHGHLTYTLTGQHGRLLAVATSDEITAAARAGIGLGPPRPTPGYTPTAAQYRYLRARDRHCRFPGCRQVALTCDADHVRPYNHRRPADGGPTCVTNLVMFCRHHHRLKTHATGWAFRLDPDGTLHVTTPGGTTRTTRPPAMDQILDLTTDPPPPYDPDDDPPPF